MLKDFTLKHLLLSEICARVICEKIVYKHSETIEYVKNQPTFLKKYKLHVQITQEFLGLGMQNSQVIAFIWTQTYREILRSTLVYF